VYCFASLLGFELRNEGFRRIIFPGKKRELRPLELERRRAPTRRGSFILDIPLPMDSGQPS